jgi:hypothetical protein
MKGESEQEVGLSYVVVMECLVGPVDEAGKALTWVRQVSEQQGRQ